MSDVRVERLVECGPEAVAIRATASEARLFCEALRMLEDSGHAISRNAEVDLCDRSDLSVEADLARDMCRSIEATLDVV